MKFTNGYWMLREGIHAEYPACVFEVEPIENGLRIIAPFRSQEHRSASIDCGMLTIDLRAPREGIIEVEIWHHIGGLSNHPEFLLFRDSIIPQISENEEEILFNTGEICAKISKKPYTLSFYNAHGQLLTDSAFRNLAYMTLQDGKHYMVEQLKTTVGEYVYGLGERFTPFVKNGQEVDMWNEDGGTSSEIAYKNITFYLTNHGYGVFVNHPGQVFFEVNSEKVSRVSFGLSGEHLHYFVIAGDTPAQILSRYTALTGRPPILPPESFGVWLSTSFTTDYNEETATTFIDGMRSRGIPLDVFHFDCFWMRGFSWCDFSWDERVFPDPKAMLARYHKKGLKICVWINPYVAQRSPLFTEGQEKGYFIKRSDGSVWQWDRWQAGMAIIDFTNPEAVDWYREKLRALLRMGVDYFKTDFGERIPEDGVYFNGADARDMHNYYTSLYNQCVFELLTEKKGEGQACLFARSATAGGQRFPVHWGGDCSANYESMAETLRGGLSLALSGFAYWSHDISGFEQTASPDVYARWAQFGLLSTHSRFHGSSSYRVPWNFGDACCAVVRRFARLKCRLMPYLYSQSLDAHETGVPVMRPMVLAKPDDPTCETLDRQYMLGAALLVAPVFNAQGEALYYLPTGQWTHLLDGRVLEGGRWIREKYSIDSLPLFVAPGTLLPVGSCEETAAYDFEKDVTLHLFALSDGMSAICRVVNRKGNVAFIAKAKRHETTLTLTSSVPVRFCLHQSGGGLYDEVTTLFCEKECICTLKE